MMTPIRKFAAEIRIIILFDTLNQKFIESIPEAYQQRCIKYFFDDRVQKKNKCIIKYNIQFVELKNKVQYYHNIYKYLLIDTLNQPPSDLAIKCKQSNRCNWMNECFFCYCKKCNSWEFAIWFTCGVCSDDIYITNFYLLSNPFLFPDIYL